MRGCWMVPGTWSGSFRVVNIRVKEAVSPGSVSRSGWGSFRLVTVFQLEFLFSQYPASSHCIKCICAPEIPTECAYKKKKNPLYAIHSASRSTVELVLLLCILQRLYKFYFCTAFFKMIIWPNYLMDSHVTTLPKI